MICAPSVSTSPCSMVAPLHRAYPVFSKETLSCSNSKRTVISLVVLSPPGLIAPAITTSHHHISLRPQSSISLSHPLSSLLIPRLIPTFFSLVSNLVTPSTYPQSSSLPFFFFTFFSSLYCPPIPKTRAPPRTTAPLFKVDH